MGTAAKAPAIREQLDKAIAPAILSLIDIVKELQTAVAKQSRQMVQQSEQIAKHSEVLAKHPELMASQTTEIRTLRSEMKPLQGEIKELKATTSALAASTLTTSPPISNTTYASIAAASQPLSISSVNSRSIFPNSSASHSGQQNLPGISIDLSGIRNPQFDLEDNGEVRKRVRQALEGYEETKGVKWIGITRNAADKSRSRICFRAEEDAMVVGRNEAWIRSHFFGARIQGEQWYPIKIDRVNKASVFNQSFSKVRDDACAKISAENQVTICKIHPLGRLDANKRYCSLAVYLPSKQEADRLLQNQVLEFDAEVDFTKPYEQIPRPNGASMLKYEAHEARRCLEREPTCGRCAAKGAHCRQVHG